MRTVTPEAYRAIQAKEAQVAPYRALCGRAAEAGNHGLVATCHAAILRLEPEAVAAVEAALAEGR